MSWWEAVIRADLIQPFASSATKRMLPSAIGKPSKREVDLTSEGLMCWGVVPKSGYMTKEAVASSDDLIR